MNQAARPTPVNDEVYVYVCMYIVYTYIYVHKSVYAEPNRPLHTLSRPQTLNLRIRALTLENICQGFPTEHHVYVFVLCVCVCVFFNM